MSVGRDPRTESWACLHREVGEMKMQKRFFWGFFLASLWHVAGSDLSCTCSNAGFLTHCVGDWTCALELQRCCDPAVPQSPRFWGPQEMKLCFLPWAPETDFSCVKIPWFKKKAWKPLKSSLVTVHQIAASTYLTLWKGTRILWRNG